jgi:HEAT repeat protein
MSLPEIHTDLLWDLSVLFGSLSILYFGFIFFFRNRISAKARNISERRKELTPMISNFLFYGEDASKEERYEYVSLKVEIREFIKDPINRSILKDILLDLQRDLTGDARTRLFSLYKDFDLHIDAFAKLKSWRWEVVTKGIVELTQMEVDEAYSVIRRFINHRRSVIRRHAQLAAVSLKHEGINHFMDSNTYPISEWQQIKILEILRNKKDFIPPCFGLWLISSHKDVVLFALRLIRHYNQTDANASVTELLKHKDEEIKQAAIDCIREFGITEAIPTLLASFARAKRDTRILILDTLGHIGNKDHIPFLKEVYLKVSDFNVRSKALGAINAIAPETVLPVENLDPRINATSDPTLENENSRPEILEDADNQPEEFLSVVVEEEITISEVGSELFYEDLEVFDHCFMEELNEILEGMNRPETDEEIGILPLDFLPVVTQKPTDMDQKKNETKLRRKLRQLRVSYEEVHPDAEFREELENILSRVEIQNPDGKTEVEYLNFKFLPFVVENVPEQENPVDHGDEEKPTVGERVEELPLVESEGEITTQEVLHPDDAAFAVPDEDTCAMVDWNLLQNGDVVQPVKENKNEAHSTEDDKSGMQTPNQGQSIFEELYGKCDEDTKWILLNQMLELGDHKELTFLQKLQEQGNARLRKRIVQVTAQLGQRLAAEEGKDQKGESLIRWITPADDAALNFELGSRESKH